MPMDMEWAKDGVDGLLYIVQARPETVASQPRPQHRSKSTRCEARRGDRRAAARSARRSPAARRGSSQSRQRAFNILPGEVLVADTTTPDWEPVMKTAAAIVTNRGGRTCHAAIVARELGIPAVVGTDAATDCIRTGDMSHGVLRRRRRRQGLRRRHRLRGAAASISPTLATPEHADHDQHRQSRYRLQH